MIPGIVACGVLIKCPIADCFDFARDLEVHTEAEKHRRERIIGPKTTGLLELGEEVTFEAVHFGIRQGLTSKIVEFEWPTKFVNEMQRGAFRRLRHTHKFAARGDETHMWDILAFAAPFGVVGRFAESAFLTSYMERFLIRHQLEFKAIVERKYDTKGQ